MTRYTRLTLVGSTRRAQVVVPSDEGFAVMLPDLLDVLGEQPTTAPQAVALVRLTGEQVDLALDCASQDLADGEVLRVVRAVEAPPPPEVVDVTDATAEAFAQRADRWDARARTGLAAVVAGVAVGLAALTGRTLVPVEARLGVLLAAAVLVAAIAAAVGRAGRHHAGAVLTGAAVGVAVGVGAAASRPGGLVALLAALATTWGVLALGVGIGRRDRGALTGAVLGLVLTGGHLLALALLADVTAHAWLAVAGLVVCGLLPWLAMTTAGLTGLDDAALDGEPPARPRVAVGLDDAYRGLSWSAVAVAVTLATATTGLVATSLGAAVALGLVAVLVTALRTRSVPLRVQVVALWGAVVVPLVAAVGTHLSDDAALTGAVLTAAAVVVGVVSGLRPSGQQRARLRRLGDVVELLAVLTVVPLLLAVLGVLGELLGTF